MSTIKVLNMAGAEVGTVELCDSIFGIEPNQAVVHEVVKNHLANCRQGTQSALTRGEVSGGGKKPWRQKGTGHARQGSTRAPQWTHGGIVFAPKPRSYSYVLNKKVKRLALKSALSAKAAEGAILVVDELKLPEIKTKAMKGFLDAVGAGKSVVITPEVDEIVVKSARNIPGVVTTTAKVLSVYDIVNAKQLVIDKAALATIEEIFGVKVAKVNTLNMQGKAKRMGNRPAGRRANWKKAMVTLTAVKADGKSLVVTPAKDEVIVKSARNIPGVETSMANLINVYDIVNAKQLVIDKAALAIIEEVYA